MEKVSHNFGLWVAELLLSAEERAGHGLRPQWGCFEGLKGAATGVEAAVLTLHFVDFTLQTASRN